MFLYCLICEIVQPPYVVAIWNFLLVIGHAIHDLPCIFEYITTGAYIGQLSADFSDINLFKSELMVLII